MTAPSRSRRRPAKKTAPYWWFQGASVRELYNRLAASNPDTAHLEVHLTGDKMTLEVVSETETAAKVRPNPPINESHVCPPQCP